MSAPFAPIEKSKPFSAAVLFEKVHNVFSCLPDSRKKATANNIKYSMEDAGLSAFSVFFTQSPSFLDYQVRMQKIYGKNNAQSVFGVHKIPSDNQIRNILDPVPPQTLYPLIAEIGDGLHQNGYLDSFYNIGNTLLVALDGTEFFSSKKISCPRCNHRSHKNGKTSYHHMAITPVIIAPGKSQVIPLPPEFITPQDGHEKQDCELAAGKRWLDAWGTHYASWGITLLGDDLYCHQPYCQEAINKGFNVIFTCKPSSHQHLYECVEGFDRTGNTHTVKHTTWNGKQHTTHCYRYINEVPLRDSDDALMLNWCEITSTNESGQVIYQNAWATTHKITDKNVADIVTAGRSRWKIENENNNILKNNGYNFDHNFGHGEQHLSNLFATLILLAYQLHTTLDWIDTAYRSIRELLPSRRTFFEHIRALLLYFPFDNWEHLMHFMLNRLNATKADTS